MSIKVLEGLKDIGYSGALSTTDALDAALQDGPKNIEYTKLVQFLTNELRPLLKIDEEVNPITCAEDSVAFVMEVSSFLKELNCPYSILTQGHISDRLQNVAERLLLLDYLSTTLMASRILQERKPDKKIELKLHETEEAANLRKILITMRFPKPPPNITVPQLFQKLIPTVQTAIQKAPSELLGNPAFNIALLDKQWETLGGVQDDLNAEYKIRREMMLTRLDVTIQSFQWSGRTKGKEEIFEKIYTEKRKALKAEPGVTLADFMAARDDIAIIEKTSNSSVRKNTQSSLNKVIIGQVPDRGGRTSEQVPPPPEMPSWQQRTPGPSGGGRGRGGNFKPQNYSNKGNYGDSGGNSNQAGGYSNAGSYESHRNYPESSNYNNQGRNFDSAGSYGYNNSRSNHGDGRNFDSAGSYGKDNYEQISKRPKTYDSFQSNRTTYADQYVGEEQHNQQYHGRGNRGRNRGRGRSNYHRGGQNYY